MEIPKFISLFFATVALLRLNAKKMPHSGKKYLRYLFPLPLFSKPSNSAMV